MPAPRLTRAQLSAQLRRQLGREHAALLDQILARAGEQPLYLVGGAVRDGLLTAAKCGSGDRPHALLGRPGNELDLMLTGRTLQDAIAFARALQSELGGSLQTHARFGTAQWRTADGITVDFANTRREHYRRPGQLPRPAPGSAEEDLWRRDFSINALAWQLHPPAAFGRLLDPCGGRADLARRQLRALHPASFRDDPTRFLRGLRLAARLGLRWEEETLRWAQASLPILARLSGSRLRAEFAQLFREPRPEDALTAPAARGLLAALHPAFLTEPRTLQNRFAAARAAPFTADPVAPLTAAKCPHALGWRLLTLGNNPVTVADLAVRFTLRKAEHAALTQAATLFAARATLADESQPPATIAAALETTDEATRLALWAAGDSALRRQLERYEKDWRPRRRSLQGRDLRRLGLPPGPRYRELLERLQVARWNGEVSSAAEERELLEQSLIQLD
ncbi:MAG: hypothetical protein OXF22_08595 [Anaerolineaceae bacterium]|nr:hypothetical protein [Anaerolineaceae bacterium]